MRIKLRRARRQHFVRILRRVPNPINSCLRVKAVDENSNKIRRTLCDAPAGPLYVCISAVKISSLSAREFCIIVTTISGHSLGRGEPVGFHPSAAMTIESRVAGRVEAKEEQIFHFHLPARRRHLFSFMLCARARSLCALKFSCPGADLIYPLFPPKLVCA
jgi:hypothetical protein